MGTGEVAGRGHLSPYRGWSPHPVTKASVRYTPTPNVTQTSAPRDPRDVSPAETTPHGGLDGPRVINGRGVSREVWRRVEARCERRRMGGISGHAGQTGHTLLCRAS